MRGQISALIFATIAAHFCFSTAAAQTFQMDQQESEDLRLLYFDPPQTYLTPHVTRSFYNSLEFQKQIFDWTPWDKTTVLLKDFSDYGNAAARSSPNNALMIDVAPLSRSFETFTASERIYSLMNHELVHVATMDVWNERDDFWRDLFRGKPMPDRKHPESILYNYLATPRVNVPRWYLEGSAVFLETWMAGGLGRAQGAYDEMVFRSMVRDDAHFYSALGLVSEGTKIDFQAGVNAYLYGTRFMNYLALEHSPEKVVEWLSRGENSKAYYSQQFAHVFGEKLTVAWDKWIDWEKSYQSENLTRVREHPVTEYESLTPRAVGSVSRAYFNPSSNSLLGAFRYPGVVAHLGELSLETGGIRHLKDIKGPMLYRVTSLAYDPETNKAWYTTDNYAFRDIIELDIATGKTKRLVKDGRIGELVLNPADKSLWGVRHLNGYPTLVRLEPPYTSWNQIHTFPYGGDLYDMDISPDGTLLATSIGKISGDQELRIYRLADLQNGKVEAIQTYAPGVAMPEGAAFSPDGRFVFGSTYYTGVSNIFRLEVATGEIEFVSNAETGFFRPIPMDDGSLIVFEYSGAGFRPVRINPQPLESVSAVSFLGADVAKKHPVVQTWAVGSPMSVELDDIEIEKSKYRPRRKIGLGSAYPIAEGFKDGVAFGYHFNFEDPMQFTQLDVTLSYSATGNLGEGDRFHADIHYQGIHWSARYWHNDADFYDLFGPTKRARSGDAFLLGYKRALVYDKPRELTVSADFGFFTGLDTLPANQNVQIVFDQIISGSVALNYTDTRKSLGGVDHEKGWRWNVGASVDRAAGNTIGRVHGGVDFGFALPISNSSVWFYNAGGFAEGNALNPLSSFYFGGFKNNYVDDREVKRYREYHTFPGFEIDEIAGRRFAKSVAEWNLPPYRFESVGTPELYLGSVRPAIFGGILYADPGIGQDEVAFSVGGQLDFNFTLSHRLPMTFSFGYASGFRDNVRRSDEFLISLKIM